MYCQRDNLYQIQNIFNQFDELNESLKLCGPAQQKGANIITRFLAHHNWRNLEGYYYQHFQFKWEISIESELIWHKFPILQPTGRPEL